MGCGGCGSSGILPGSLSARNNRTTFRVRGYSGSGIIRSEQRLAKEAEKLKAEAKASEDKKETADFA